MVFLKVLSAGLPEHLQYPAARLLWSKLIDGYAIRKSGTGMLKLCVHDQGLSPLPAAKVRGRLEAMVMHTSGGLGALESDD